ncbi:MAG: ABC-type phosphate transport system ATPase component [Candidatus Scalindua rubra]|uniref:ABC-type phosphate transport system ATPase component n=1 Tax=Candidatus Scalindua rubra TaxID=1872076 RepID=A0A1E3X6W4_9BACT|nr:MAG: ABC-type phosphate transport system ATPase component [Candidatus Scalindua rubra]
MIKIVNKLTYPEKELEESENIIIGIKDFNAWFNDFHVLKDVCVGFREKSINCIIGPSGSGKSTLIRSINRINDDVDGFIHQGDVLFNGHIHGRSIYHKDVDVNHLRTKVGMVFQKPCVFPKSIYENALLGVKYLKKLSKHEKLRIVEENLNAVSLWKEVSNRLHEKATTLSIGQQQRLCIARTLAVKPTVILLDEPTSSLDPVSTYAIEKLMLQLKEQYTIIFITHNIVQAKRIADYLVFMCEGQVIEEGTKEKLFSNPDKQQTKDYLSNEYCEC